MEFDDKEYYLVNGLKETYPPLFVGCKKSMLKFIEHHGLENQHIWARLVDGKYKYQEKRTNMKMDKLFVRKDWVDQYMATHGPSIINKSTGTNDIVNQEPSNESPLSSWAFQKTVLWSIKYIMSGGQKALAGVKWTISFICYGSSRMVGAAFISEKSGGAGSNMASSNMASSVNSNTVNTDIGVPPMAMKMAFDIFASTIPCIYLIRLGTASELYTKLGAPISLAPDVIIFKYGMTDNLERRLAQHKAKYGKMGINGVMLAKCAMIDMQFIRRAEAEARDYFALCNLRLKIKGENELVGVPRGALGGVYEKYGAIMNKYVGHYRELIDKMDKQALQYERRLNECKDELAKKDRRIIELIEGGSGGPGPSLAGNYGLAVQGNKMAFWGPVKQLKRINKINKCIARAPV